MKKTKIILVLLFYYFSNTAQVNLDFESGNFTGWTGRVGNTSIPGIMTAVGTPTIWTMGVNSSIWNQSYHTITTGAGTDQFGGFPVVAPGGSFSARLGGSGPNVNNGGGCGGSPGSYICPKHTGYVGPVIPPFSGAESLEQSFVVNASNAIVTLQYAAIFNNGSHSGGATVNPFFRAEVLDATGASITNCLTYTFVLNKTSLPSGAFQSPSSPCYYMPPATGSVVVCMPWQRKIFDLTSQIGQTVTVKFSAGGCNEGGHFGYAYIDASAGPKSLIQTGGAGCVGPVTLTGPTQYGSTYSWAGPSGGITASSANSATVNATGTYSLTVGTGPCAITFTTAVNLSSPTITALSSSQSVCSGASISGINFTPSPAGATINWSNTNTSVGLTASGSGSISAYSSPIVTSQQTAIITATPSFGGCSGPAKTFTITVNPYPNLSVVSNPIITCTSTIAVLSSTSTTSGTTFSWSPGGSSPTSSATTVSSSGNYTLNASVGSCVTTSVVTVSTNTTLPNVSANVTSTLTCSSNTTTLNGSSLTSGVTYSWSPGGSTPTNSTTVVSAGGNYTLYATDPSNGCRTSTVITVSQNTATPIVSSSSSGTLNCTLTSVNASATTSTTPVSYTWSGTGITSPTNTSSITVNQPGTYNYTITNTSNGCIALGSQAVSQNTVQPIATASLATAITCTSTSAILNGGPASGVTYSWSGAGLSGATNLATATVTNTGSYTLTTTSTVNGCTNTAVVSATANTSQPQISTGPDAIINCAIPNATLSGSSTTSGVTYSWNPGGSAPSSSTTIVNTGGTYTLTVTNPVNGCTNTAVQSVVQNTIAPNVTVGSTQTVSCSSPTVILTGSSTASPVNYSWTGPSSGNPAGSTPTNSTTTVGSAGNYTLIVTNSVNSCTNSAIVAIVQNTSTPVVTGTISGVLNCTSTSVNASLTTTTSPVSYTWSGVGITSPTNTNSITVNQPGTFNYTVTNTINGCSTTGTQSISQNTIVPTTTLTPSSLTTTCASPTATLLVTSSSDPNSVYTWTVPIGGSLNNTNSNNPVASGSGVFTVAVTNTLNGCVSAIQTVTITADANTPVLSTSSSSSVICSGSSSTLTVSGADSYTWSANAGSVITNTVVVSPTTSTTYSVIGTNTLTGCSNVTNITIIANTTPTLGVSSNVNSICIGDNAIINLTGATSYTLTNPLIVTTSSVVVTPTTLTTYTVIGETANCFSSTETISINVNPLPTLSATASNTTICSGSTATLSITGADSYTWSTTETAATITVTPTTTTTYSATGTNTTTGCSNITNVTVNVTPTPTIGVAVTPTTICEGNSTTVTLTGATNYTVTNPAQTTTNTIVLTPTSPTTYTITGESQGCASTTETITIDVNALPIIAVSNATTCAGTAVTLSANGADTYNWQPTGSTTNTTTVSPTNNTTYTVTGTNTVTGCTSTITTVDVTVNALPTVTATANPNTTCTTGTVNLTANTTATSYTWTTGNGVDNTNQNQGTISFPASTLTTGTYTYTVTVTDVNGCVSPQASTTINIIDVPNANFDLSDLVICQNENGTISINTPQTGVTYDWNINGQTIPNTNPLTVPSTITNASGTYTVNVIAGIGTCTNTAANTLTVNALPTVSLINAQVSACENASAQLDVAGPNSTYTYNWTNGTNTSTGTNLTVNPLTQATQGTYTVTATDANGCTNRTTGKVDIKICETFVPEFFSPNGDGKNDGFVIKNIENYPNNNLKIFNRWGNLVYQKDGYQNEFEGYANVGDAAGQEKLPAGTYYVILVYGDEETETYNGYLLLQY